MAFEGEDEKGEVIIYYIKTIANGKVEVDGNHPWAGERINFSAIIEDVRTAKDEEISNKYVQQPGEKKH
jgi:FKBP-type peptidyl-prolyl cis-trans isomerase SlyD